jgi:phosphomannomutase
MVVLAELAHSLYREQGVTLKHHMEHLYSKYGLFCSKNGYYSMPDPGVSNNILDNLRSGGTYQTLKDIVGQTDRTTVHIRDLGHPGFDSAREDQTPVLPISKSAPLLTIRLSGGCLVQLRPSGTEPKFKYYLEMQGQPGMPEAAVLAELNSVQAVLLDKLLEPAKNGLTKKG